MHFLRAKSRFVKAGGAIKVWDAPTRLFHWLLVALLGFSWWCAETDRMDWHRLSGSVLLGLLVFRLIWGFIGASTARFSSFVRSPSAVMAYLRMDPAAPRSTGHNPIGAYSVAIMLLLLTVQIGTGLFAVDLDGLESGQLSHLVSFDQGRAAAEIHELSFKLLQVVAILHVAAILFYVFVRKRNLIGPMVTGSELRPDVSQAALVPASPARLIVAVVVAAALAWWTAKGFSL